MDEKQLASDRLNALGENTPQQLKSQRRTFWILLTAVLAIIALVAAVLL